MRFDRSSMALSIILLGGCSATAPNPGAHLEVAAPFTSSGDYRPAPAVRAPVAEGSNGLAGQWEFLLNGSGASDKKFNAGNASASAALGLFLTDYLELAVRQGVFWEDSVDSEASTNGSTIAALDINFGSGAFRPILGVQAGKVYGDGVLDTWVAGPEAGFKLYVKKDVFLQLLAQYEFFFKKGDELDEQFPDGSFVYALGFGVNF